MVLKLSILPLLRFGSGMGKQDSPVTVFEQFSELSMPTAAKSFGKNVTCAAQ